jgi:hypothetical protein
LSLKYLYYRYEPPCLVPHLSLLSWSFSSSLIRTTLQRTPWFSCTQPERKGELMSFPVAIVDHKRAMRAERGIPLSPWRWSWFGNS